MRRLTWFFIGFACACLNCVYLMPGSALGWSALTAGALCAGLRLLQRRSEHTLGFLRAGCVLTLGLTVGLIWCKGYGALASGPSLTAAGEVPDAVLCSSPVATAYGCRADAEVRLNGRSVKVRLYLNGEVPALLPGDRITGPFSLRLLERTADGRLPPELPANGIWLTGTGSVTEAADGSGSGRFFFARLSRRVFDRLGELIPADAAGLPQAMLTGNRAGLTELVTSDLSYSGASHIVAVSGLHVTLLMGALVVLAGRKRRTVWLGLSLLLCFVLMTGASASVVRAALMLGLLMLAPLFKRENDPLTSLSVAGLLLLTRNPWTVANLGFQLSFAAVAGLLLAARPLNDYLISLPVVRRMLRWSGLKRLPFRLRNLLIRGLRSLVRGVCGGIAATLGALCFSAPLAAAVFGFLPVYGILTNLIVLPLAAVCLTGALAVLVLGLVSTALGSLGGRLLAVPVRLLLRVCGLVSRLPGSRLYMDAYGIAFFVLAALVLLLVLALREKRLGAPLLSVLACLLAAVGLQTLEARSAGFRYAVLDVGQGQCVCMKVGSFTAITDCGGSDGASAGAAAADWLRQNGADRLDALILTHYDDDHIGGVETLLSLVPVSAVYLPPVDFDPENRAAVETAARAAGTALHSVTENLTLRFQGGQVRLFCPVSDRNDNAACVCVLYSAAEYDMLITGDLDAAAESALLEQNALPRAEIYVAGHHGSAGSSSETLLNAVRPDTVLISVGRNPYGLPSAETLFRLEACGADVYRTDECGNLEIGR